MRVLCASSEVYPFAKTGGLADVAYSLPKAIAGHGVSVSCAMPLYKSVDIERFQIKPLGKEVKVTLPVGTFNFEIFGVENDVRHYFLKNDELFGRDYLYGPPEGDYPDNDVRFGAFCAALIDAVKKGYIKADIIHSNDWQTSLIPVLIKKEKLPLKSVLTIHNLAYQGIFPKDTIEKLSLGWELFNMEALEFWGNVNFLKGGIVFSDAVTTVSPTYAKEIMTPEFGCGLDGVLRKHSHKLFGILNGIDYDIWNPETDRYIYENYSENDISRKETNKRLFLKEFGLSNPSLPLFIFIGRFAEQKGIDLIMGLVEQLAKLPANFAILGFGDERYNNFFKRLEGKLPNIFVKVAYDEALSRKMYAAADFLLMPSKFEPCGLNQMIAMRYGTLVVARRTGGLADTVIDISEPEGYGILFEDFKQEELFRAIKRALKLYEDIPKITTLRQLVMSFDFSWSASASKYIRLFEEVLYGWSG